MYNPDLEALIDAALADGELTEKEKQILFKKAQSMGVDLDEFEMVLDARLVKLKKAEQEKSASSAPKSNKLGDVKKCPACGAIVQSYQGVCSECGYAFENLEANRSSEKLAQKIEAVNSKYDDRIARAKEDADNSKWHERKNKDAALAQVVKTFPVPSTKSDLFEFLSSMQSSMLDLSTPYTMADAYRAKYTECILKAKSLFPGDSIFANFINEQETVNNEYKKVHKKQKKVGLKPSVKMIIGCVIAFVVLFAFCGIMAAIE